MFYTSIIKLSKRALKGLLLGCVATSFCTSVQAFEKDKLLIWSKEVFGNEGFKALGKKFERETGIEVTIHIPNGEVIGDFNRAVVLGKGPDIYLRPHDRIGELAKAGMLAEVVPGGEALTNIDETFWQAVSFGGKYYGYPISVEGPTQICNKALKATPFRNFNEIAASQSQFTAQNKIPIIWDYQDTYFAYGFLSAEGGYAFARENGVYNTADTGVNHPGAIRAVQAMKKLYDNNILPTEINYGVFDNAFKSQRSACVINGPWAWAGYQAAGIELAIGNYPTPGDSGTPSVFFGVLAAIVNQASTNQAIAKRFIEDYLLQPEGLKLINDDEPMGAVTHQTFMAQLASEDPLLADAYEVWKLGQPMPNVPKMGKFWTHTKTGLLMAVQGQVPVKKAMDDAAARIVR